MKEPDYKELLVELLIDLSLSDHLGDVYGECIRTANKANLLVGYDEDKEYRYDLYDDGDCEGSVIEDGYAHLAHFLKETREYKQ